MEDAKQTTIKMKYLSDILFLLSMFRKVSIRINSSTSNAWAEHNNHFLIITIQPICALAILANIITSICVPYIYAQERSLHSFSFETYLWTSKKAGHGLFEAKRYHHQATARLSSAVPAGPLWINVKTGRGGSPLMSHTMPWQIWMLNVSSKLLHIFFLNRSFAWKCLQITQIIKRTIKRWLWINVKTSKS